jgi:hypothetical protein
MGIFGPKREAGETGIISIYILCILHKILMGNQI